MRVLHVGDVAGVSGVLAKYQHRLGHMTSVVNRDGYDPYKLQEFYRVSVVGPKRKKGLVFRTLNVLWFYCYVAWCSRRYDIVHIHSQYLVWFFIPFKAKVLEFHGTDVRRYPTKRWSIDAAVTTIFFEVIHMGDFPIRILHVNDCAGVGATLAKYQRQLGHTVTVAKLGNWDGRGIDDYYGLKVTFTPQKSSTYKIAKKHLPKSKVLRRFLYKFWSLYPTFKLYFYVAVQKKNFDVLHIHGKWGTVFFIGNKPKILEFHGDDVRQSPSKYGGLYRMVVRLFVRNYASKNKVYVSTPDLLGEVPNGFWIPNIADTDHFKPCPKELGTALYSQMWYEDGSHAKAFAEANNLQLTVLNRKDQAWVDFRDFPMFLGKFEYYIDRQAIHSFSKTALEALAVGCKVVDWQGKVFTELPKIHDPLTVAKLTIQIYEQQIGGKKK